MGYLTDFTLSFYGDPIEDIVETLDSVTQYFWDEDLVLHESKWYDWQKHMREISRKYPDRLFVLEGVGEEQGDQWKAYIKDGKIQICNAIITFEPFDESKMK